MGHPNPWFVMSTNIQHRCGFVAANFVLMTLVLTTTETYVRVAWRVCLGLGIIPPLSLRIELQEPEQNVWQKMVKYPV